MPTLTVQVINKTTNTILNEKFPTILLDDSIKQIKEKIFVFFPDFIPNLIKLEIQNDKQEFMSITNSNSLLYEIYEIYDIIPDQPIIFITNLQDIISNINIQELYTDENIFKIELENLQKEFIDLTADDLSFIIKLNLINLGLTTDIDISDLQDYINSNQNNRNKLLQVIEKQENDNMLQQFYKLATDFLPEINKISYNNINLRIKGDNFISGTKGIFIKLNDIFNMIELNDNIPFIALGKKSSNINIKQPQIKIYNKLLNIISDREIKSWVLNERKKINEATYKIIKGLMIKSKFKDTTNYLTINILSNGLIDVNLKTLDYDYENLEETLKDIKENVNQVINYINLLPNVFLQSKRIENIDNSTVKLISLDTIIETGIFINRTKFESIIKNVFISKIIELKKTESIEILSGYYKKIISRSIEGITINIKDNPYKEDSSLIKIFSANTPTQAQIIMWNILVLNELGELIKTDGLFEDFSQKRKIRAKTRKKNLKEQGIYFDSRECQSGRQPQLNPNNLPPLIDDSYTITFNNKNYRCDNPDYPYPGFTKNNIVCCFKHNQSGNETYIKNVDQESLNIFVEPSNFKISINNSFETYVIKIISTSQNIPKYYYLSNTNNKLSSQNDIIPIYNQELIDAIDQEENIWLNRVPLSQIIYPSASNKCNFKPDLNNRISLHSPCNAYENNPYFGYTSKSIPCCFDKERPIYDTRKKKETDITKQYIIKSADKILNFKQLGILPQDISTLIQDILQINNVYYRMGIIQNTKSFLNVILLGIDNVIQNHEINNYNEFENFISDYLLNNQTEFSKLNNGDISLKYTTIQNYINYINNDSLNLNWFDIIDLLERILNINIVIIDITEETKLLCRPIPFNQNNFDKPFVLLLKKNNMFEIIVQLIVTDNKNDIVKQFTYQDKLIRFLTKYYTDTCISKNIYPENYPYIPIFSHQSIISLFEKSKDSIIYQIVNDFNKINMLMTNKNFLIPILETGIIDNPKIKLLSFSKLITDGIESRNKLLTLDQYSTYLKSFNKMIQENTQVKILGIVNTNIDTIGGIVTNFNYIIPYKKDNKSHSYEIFDYKYYLDIDTKLHQLNDSSFNNYNISIDESRNTLFELRKLIGNTLSENLFSKNDIEELIKNTKMSRGKKIKKILKIFKSLNISADEKLLQIISNEILNDTKENLILNNVITSDIFNQNDVIIRNEESLLLNISDIRKWIKKYQTKI